MERLTGALAEALKRGRSTFNAKFALLEKASVPIDTVAFHQHLAATLDPIVNSVAREFPERTDAVVLALYDLSLDLFSKVLLGPAARYPAITRAWQTLLPLVPQLMAREPARLTGIVTNALYNLSRTPGARPEIWTQHMIPIAPVCESIADFMNYGALTAWRSGMPHYRLAALDRLSSMSPDLAAKALSLPLATSMEAISAAAAALRLNPWIRPQDALDARPAIQLKNLATAGAFRGFGGPFLAPPTVGRVDGQLTVTDDGNTWRLFADIYNAVLLRCEPSPPDLPNNDVQIQDNGTVLWRGHARRFPELAGATSIAAVEHTVAITLSYSHHVFLLGMV